MNCFMSVNLRNKQYCIFNKQYTRESYMEMMKEIDMGDRRTREELINHFRDIVLSVPKKYLSVQNITKCTGDNILDSVNCQNCYGIKNCQNCRYILDIMHYKDAMDSYSGGKHSELIYESTSVAASSRAISCLRASHSHDVSYSWFISSSSNIFGCVGLKHKEYCILNRQYSKEEYLELIPKIIKHMNDMPYVDEKGLIYKYGEFFPESFSPFAYNETTAQEYFYLSNGGILNRGYKTREPDEKKYIATIEGDNLPLNISEINDSITEEIISCIDKGDCSHQCTKAFRIIPAELEFYRRMNIPLPNKCPNCRHYERLKYRNPINLWHRKCQCAGIQSDNGVYQNTMNHGLHDTNHCEEEFETSYSPDRPEIVYCEKCYQQEVY